MDNYIDLEGLYRLQAIELRAVNEWRMWREAQKNVIGQSVQEDIAQKMKMLEHILGYVPSWTDDERA